MSIEYVLSHEKHSRSILTAFRFLTLVSPFFPLCERVFFISRLFFYSKEMDNDIINITWYQNIKNKGNEDTAATLAQHGLCEIYLIQYLWWKTTAVVGKCV